MWHDAIAAFSLRAREPIDDPIKLSSRSSRRSSSRRDHVLWRLRRKPGAGVRGVPRADGVRRSFATKAGVEVANCGDLVVAEPGRV